MSQPPDGIDPYLLELIQIRREESEQREREHARVRASAPFQQELVRLNRVTDGLLALVQSSWLHSSRHPPLLDGLLMYAMTDDAIESLVAIRSLIDVGVHNMARRECRYLLEAATKHLYVDQQLPNVGEVTRAERLEYLRTKVPRSSIEPVREVDVLLGDNDSIEDFRNDVKNLWSSMAAYVHPSATQTDERLSRATRGAYIGYEDVASLRRLVKEVVRTYDILGVLWLMAAGPSAAGDILEGCVTSRWAFVRTRWLPAMARHYEYKIDLPR